MSTCGILLTKSIHRANLAGGGTFQVCCYSRNALRTPCIPQNSFPRRGSDQKRPINGNNNQSLGGSDVSVLIYRWPSIKHFRFISRFKIYQVSVMLALLAPMTHWYNLGLIASKTLVSSYAASLGTTAVLLVISHYFTRVIGELRYKASNDTLRISTLTFWGNRKEAEFCAGKVVDFLESQTRMGGAIQKLEVRDQSVVYLWSLKYGRVLCHDLLCKVLKITDMDLRYF